MSTDFIYIYVAFSQDPIYRALLYGRRAIDSKVSLKGLCDREAVENWLSTLDVGYKGTGDGLPK